MDLSITLVTVEEEIVRVIKSIFHRLQQEISASSYDLRTKLGAWIFVKILINDGDENQAHDTYN